MEMKSTGLIFQDFSIAGLKKQWEYQHTFYLNDLVVAYAGEKELIGGTVINLQPGMVLINDPSFPDNPKWSKNEYTRLVKRRFPEGSAQPYPNGCKVETRRTRGLDKVNENPNMWKLQGLHETPAGTKNGGIYAYFSDGKNPATAIKCPFGVVGDEIYVKESFAKFDLWGHDSEKKTMKNIATGYKYKADNEAGVFFYKSPLFMPKAAARIFLEITSINVERLQDITAEGAVREGVETFDPNWQRAHFLLRWKELHGEESNKLNPFVWVIGFKVKEFRS